MKFLREKDPFIRTVMIEVANEARELQRNRDRECANMIAHEVGEMLSKIRPG